MASTAREAQAGVGAAQSRGKLGGARTVAVALVDGLVRLISWSTVETACQENQRGFCLLLQL